MADAPKISLTFIFPPTIAYTGNIIQLLNQ